MGSKHAETRHYEVRAAGASTLSLAPASSSSSTTSSHSSSSLDLAASTAATTPASSSPSVVLPALPASPVLHERRNSFQPKRRGSLVRLLGRGSASAPDLARFGEDAPDRARQERLEHCSILGADPAGRGFYLYPRAAPPAPPSLKYVTGDPARRRPARRRRRNVAASIIIEEEAAELAPARRHSDVPALGPQWRQYARAEERDAPAPRQQAAAGAREGGDRRSLAF